MLTWLAMANKNQLIYLGREGCLRGWPMRLEASLTYSVHPPMLWNATTTTAGAMVIPPYPYSILPACRKRPTWLACSGRNDTILFQPFVCIVMPSRLEDAIWSFFDLLFCTCPKNVETPQKQWSLLLTPQHTYCHALRGSLDGLPWTKNRSIDSDHVGTDGCQKFGRRCERKLLRSAPFTHHAFPSSSSALALPPLQGKNINHQLPMWYMPGLPYILHTHT